ncbi:hypothetical protein ACIPN8_12140, partial [Streptomyces sp. NPDC086082]
MSVRRRPTPGTATTITPSPATEKPGSPATAPASRLGPLRGRPRLVSGTAATIPPPSTEHTPLADGGHL